MKKVFQYVKNNKKKVILVLLIILVIIFILLRPKKEVKRDVMMASNTTIIQEIDVTGRIEPAKEVQLAVESGGKVGSVNVTVGQKVVRGQTLLQVNTSDLQVRLARQEAALEKARLLLSKEEPKTNASDDLEKAYEDGYNAVANAFLDLPSVIIGLDVILNHSYLSKNTIITFYSKATRTFRDGAEDKYYIAEKAYNEALNKYRNSSRQSSEAAIESLIVATYDATKIIADAVKTINNFVDHIEDQIDDSFQGEELASDQDTLAEFTSQTNLHLSELLTIKDTIKDSNTGITDEKYDIAEIKINIQQAELDIRDTEVQINNRTIRAPISGTVSRVDAEVGETISANNPVISIISSNQFQIKANLPESDVAKVRVGADASITLDAYGSDIVFLARVVAVDPAETLLEGVATYKTTFEFMEKDDRIKSGMTADIIIKGDYKENVLAIPQRAVTTKGGKKYVQILEGGLVVERVVQTGLKGTDGNIEVTNGVNEGEEVIVFSEKE